jgi:IQ calmodulin-binding motif
MVPATGGRSEKLESDLNSAASCFFLSLLSFPLAEGEGSFFFFAFLFFFTLWLANAGSSLLGLPDGLEMPTPPPVPARNPASSEAPGTSAPVEDRAEFDDDEGPSEEELRELAAVSIQRSFRGHLARRRFASVRKLNRVLGELRDTEKTYSEQLGVAAKVLLPAMVSLLAKRAGEVTAKAKKARPGRSKSGVDACAGDDSHAETQDELVATLYSNLSELAEVHAEIYAEMSAGHDRAAPALSLLVDDEICKLYSRYCVLHTRFTVSPEESLLQVRFSAHPPRTPRAPTSPSFVLWLTPF